MGREILHTSASVGIISVKSIRLLSLPFPNPVTKKGTCVPPSVDLPFSPVTDFPFHKEVTAGGVPLSPKANIVVLSLNCIESKWCCNFPNNLSMYFTIEGYHFFPPVLRLGSHFWNAASSGVGENGAWHKALEK